MPYASPTSLVTVKVGVVMVSVMLLRLRRCRAKDAVEDTTAAAARGSGVALLRLKDTMEASARVSVRHDERNSDC